MFSLKDIKEVNSVTVPITVSINGEDKVIELIAKSVRMAEFDAMNKNILAGVKVVKGKEKSYTIVDMMCEMVTGWNLSDECNAKNIHNLTEMLWDVPSKFLKSYVEARSGFRRKN